jgi:hypothetical protein
VHWHSVGNGTHVSSEAPKSHEQLYIYCDPAEARLHITSPLLRVIAPHTRRDVDYINLNECSGYYTSRSVFFTDASYGTQNNLQGLVESGPTESCLGCEKIREIGRQFDIYEATL